MNKKAVRWLYRELPELVNKGILSGESADRLRRHYGEIKSAGKTAVTPVILGASGALLIGLGIILLLAHNWEQLSRFTRAFLSLLPLLAAQGLALWVILKRPGSAALKEATAVFLSLMAGASIALISQTYNIPGDYGTFVLTWSLLIIPVVYLMQASLPAAIYLIGITVWSGSCWEDNARAILFWPLAAVVIPHYIWALRREIYGIRTILLTFVTIFCVSFAAGFSLGRTWPDSWIIIFPALYYIFYSLGCLKIEGITTAWQRPMRFMGTIGLLLLAFQFTFSSTWQYADAVSPGSYAAISGINVWTDHIITAAIVGISVVLLYGNLKRKNWEAAALGALPLLSIAGYLIGERSAVLPLAVFNIYLLILGISRIVSGARNNNPAVINTGMLIMAVLIAARFFDSDINFIIKGSVFIAVGIGFLAVNLALARRKGGAR